MLVECLVQERKKDGKKEEGLAYSDSSVGCVLYGSQEIIVSRIECNGKCAIDDSPIYVDPKIDLHDILFSKNLLGKRR